MKGKYAAVAAALVLVVVLAGCSTVKEAWDEGWEAGARSPAETSAPIQVSEAFAAPETIDTEAIISSAAEAIQGYTRGNQKVEGVVLEGDDIHVRIDGADGFSAENIGEHDDTEQKSWNDGFADYSMTDFEFFVVGDADHIAEIIMRTTGEEFEPYWNTITVEYSGFGKIVYHKSDVEVMEDIGKYVPDSRVQIIRE